MATTTATATLTAALDRVDAIADVIRADAAETERLGHLAPNVLAALHDANLFRILVPVELGGYGLTIPESIEVYERVAACDASTGWTLTILSGGGVFARRLPADVFATICGDSGGLVAGSLNPMAVRARATADGYVFSGRATYLSGSAHARWVMAAAVVFDDNDAPVITDGLVDIRSGIFPIERARNLDTWKVTGMRGTGSNDYEFEDVEVAHDWTFQPLAPVPAGADVFSRIPLWAQLGGGLSASAVGTARNMIDRFIELAAVKVPVGNFTPLAERPAAQIALGEAEGLYQVAHAALLETARSNWSRGEAGEPFDFPVLARQRLAFVTAVRLAGQAVDLLHDAAGMSAVALDSVLDRCWRDVHTISQHVILSSTRFEVGGRVLMGLDPGAPII